MTCDEQHKKRSARDDEADSPHRKIIPPSQRGKRPSSADRRHEELLSAVMDQSSAVTESLEVIRTSITDMQKQYQMFDLQKQIMDCAQKIQRNWDKRFAFLLSQKVPPHLIIEQLGPRPTKEEATKEQPEPPFQSSKSMLNYHPRGTVHPIKTALWPIMCSVVCLVRCHPPCFQTKC
eukprot:scaffold1133_cov367-Pavlova_lutheri.AAC.2